MGLGMVGDGWGAVKGLTPQCERSSKGGGGKATPEDDGALPQASPRIQVSKDPQVEDVTPLNW